MKKTYIEPLVMAAEIELVTFVCGSQDITSGSDVNDITYGGVDEQGTKDPASRRQRNLWEDEEEEELF